MDNEETITRLKQEIEELKMKSKRWYNCEFTNIIQEEITLLHELNKRFKAKPILDKEDIAIIHENMRLIVYLENQI